MPSHLTSPWNYAVSYLDMLYRDQKLGSGSGLFWKLDDRTFLISNWHNGNRGPCEQEPPRVQCASRCLLQLRPRLPCVPAFLKLRLGFL
jgi:hypothetical protein